MEAPLSAIGLVLALIEVAGISFAMDAILHGRTSEGAIAWAVSLVFFPPVAIPLYLIFGSRKFQGYVEARRSKIPALQSVTNNLLQELEDNEFIVTPRATNPFHKAFGRLSIIPPTSSNRASILIDGDETYPSILSDIGNAQDYILVQFYLIRHDRIGHRFKTALCKKAEAGTRVFLLYDDIGSIGLSEQFIKDLKRSGVRIYGFNANKRRRNRFQLNFRNHRKIVVVDGAVAFVGGLNIGDEYLGKNPAFGDWRDTHTRVEGPAVLGIQLAFLEDWYWATGEIPDLDWKTKPTPPAPTGQIVWVVASGPSNKLETAGLLFANAINSARKRVWIASPYFAPDRAIVSALQSAALRGVDVKIMLPERADLLLVHLVSFAYIEDIGSVGIQFYRYQPGILHHKILAVDDEVSAVGTANLDNRSFRINFEITLLFKDEEFSGKVRNLFLNDLSHCEKVRADELSNRPAWFRLLFRSARLLAPIL